MHHTCTACHGVALIKAQGLTRELWDSTFGLILQKHCMSRVQAADRAEVLESYGARFPSTAQPRSR